MGNELWKMGAVELARGIKEKRFKSREAVEAHLARIEEVNPQVNAVTVVLAESAIASADEADKKTASGADLGPLHGVPFTVKENIDLVGSPTTQGVHAMVEAFPPQDAPHIKQIKEAGAIPFGRTNLPDFGLRWHTDNDLRGATKNPWDASRTPGGSSGGEAAALATGMTPLGMGNDLGGSLRWPSQCCGTTAIKPTLGRVAWASSLPPGDDPITIQLFATQGPMARRVEDLRVALAAMAGYDARNPWWTPALPAGQTHAHPRKVAMAVDPGGAGVDDQVADGVRKAGKVLADAGYEVEEVDLPRLIEAAQLWQDMVLTEVTTAMLPMIEPLVSDDARSFLGSTSDLRPTLDFAGYIQAFAQRQSIARDWQVFLDDYALVLGPVFTIRPFEVGYDLKGGKDGDDLTRAARLTVAAGNLLGLPAVAVPVGVAEGLPQVVQLIGGRFREELCLDAAQAIEDSCGLLTPIDPK